MITLFEKYKDVDGNTIEIIRISKNTIIAGTDENSIEYLINGKKGYRMLENSIYAKSLIKL